MIARFRGRCAECDLPINIGDQIEDANAGVTAEPAWVHMTCPPEVPHGDVCPACHIEKALDGSCECAEGVR